MSLESSVADTVTLDPNENTPTDVVKTRESKSKQAASSKLEPIKDSSEIKIVDTEKTPDSAIEESENQITEQPNPPQAPSSKKQPNKVRNSNNMSRRIGDKFAKKSKRIDDGRKREFPTIKHTLEIESTTVIALLQRNISNWAAAAAQHVPMMQLANRVPEARELIEQFHSTVKGNAHKYLQDIQSEINMLLENNLDLKRRYAGTEAGTPGEFIVTFMHPYFWDYISIIEKADETCAQIERIGLCGVDIDQVESYLNEIAKYVSTTFRVLEYVSKLKRTNRRNNNKPFDEEQFLIILANYQKQIDSLTSDVATD